jgi:hypothetical protein
MLISQQAPVMDQVAFDDLPDLAAPYAAHETQVLVPIIAQEAQSNSGLDPAPLIPFVAIAGLAWYGAHRHRAKKQKKQDTSATPATVPQTAPRNHWLPPEADKVNQPRKPVELTPLAGDDPNMGF